MSQRLTTVTVQGVVNLWVSDCSNCGVIFAITKELEQRRRTDRKTFYCPNGHTMWFPGKTEGEQLREATARETHLKDQLSAATRNEEAARSELMRIRSRIAAGICPCCRRTFSNVARHIENQHPDFAVPAGAHSPSSYRCSCGRKFDTFRGLRIHQGQVRPEDWDAPGKSRTNRWDGAHLTEVAAR